MENTSLRIGDGNWAVKESNLLGYNVIQNKYVPIEMNTVRATSATRVNESGLIEIPATNLFLQSEEFNNGYWTKFNTTISANTEIAPNGTLTADTYIGSAVAAPKSIAGSFSVTSGATYTISIFAKKNTNNFIQVLGGSSAFGVDVWANFDLQNGVIGSIGLLSTAKIEDYGNGWYRCQVTGNSISATSPVAGFALITSNTSLRTANNSLTTSVYLWGAQVEQGSTATEYIPTIASIRTKFAGITQDGGSASNIPRVDYSSGTASLLVEPQRTNLLLRSEEFDNASWVKPFGWTITPNATISPDGTSNADLVTPTNFNNINQTSIVSISTNYTVSIYLKRNTTNTSWVSLLFTGGTTISYGYIVNWPTLTLTLISARTPAVSPKIESVGNDWYRISYVCASGNNTSSSLQIIPDSQAGTASLFLWGAQLEAGSYATSYIPTVASTVTRNADVINKTGISSLIGQTEGTIFVEFERGNNSEFLKCLFSLNTGLSNSIVINSSGANTATLQASVNTDGVLVSSFFNIISGTNKVILRYNTNSFSIFLNGALLSNTGITSLPSMSTLALGSRNVDRYWGSGIDNFALYKTALTNEQCINLTTL